MKDSLDDIPIGARQNLPEDSAGDLDKKRVPLGAVQPRRLEPGGKGVDTDPGLDPFEEFVPGIHRFALAPRLSCCRHRKRKETPVLFPQMCKTCGRQSDWHLSSGFGILARAGTP